MGRRPAGRASDGKNKSIWAILGSQGGRARALRLSAKERRRIAMLGVRARLAKKRIKNAINNINKKNSKNKKSPPARRAK